MVEVKDGWLIINEDVNDLSLIDFRGQKKIYFGHEFNSPINSLPDHITHITFSEWDFFNKLIDKWPNKLKNIQFYFCYNRPCLPNIIKYMMFGELCYNQPVNYLPNDVIDNLPLTIKYIIFTNTFFRHNDTPIFLNKFVKKIKINVDLKFTTHQQYYHYYLHHYTLIDLYGSRQLYYKRGEINKHNHAIRKTKLVDLLLK